MIFSNRGREEGQGGAHGQQEGAGQLLPGGVCEQLHRGAILSQGHLQRAREQIDGQGQHQHVAGGVQGCGGSSEHGDVHE